MPPVPGPRRRTRAKSKKASKGVGCESELKEISTQTRKVLENKPTKTTDRRERKNLLADALLLQKSGVFSIVLECIETNLAKKITKQLKIPTIGIGSSLHCDGQVLVTDDLIGLNITSIKFVKSFCNIRKHIEFAVKKFKRDVKNKKYPSRKYSY